MGGTALRDGAAWPRRTVAVLGTVMLLGTVAEPASWGARNHLVRTRWARATVAVNLLSGAALFLAGTRPRAGSSD